jgi:hypothetical protein
VHAHETHVCHRALLFAAAVAGIPEPPAEYTMLSLTGATRESARTVADADVRWLAMRAEDARA